MSVFLFRFAKHSSAPSIRHTDLSKYLPREPHAEKIVCNGPAEIRIFSYDAALDKPIQETSEGFVFSQGYLPRAAFTQLSERLLDEYPITLLDYPESFCAIAYRDGKFGYTSAGTGADQLFTLETSNAIFVTNRHNLLGNFARKVSFRKESFWWMAGRSHIGDSGTYWNEIVRSLPSRKYIYNGVLQIVETNYDGLFQRVQPVDIPEVMSDIVDHFRVIMDDVSSDKRISLTGGKDSRAILGLISALDQTDRLVANTTGYYFSPDVLAAQGLTGQLGISKQHKITRPQTFQATGDVASRVVDDLLFDFAGRSLADIGKFSFAGDLVLGGHEAGIKSLLNHRQLDEFVHSRRFWVDDRKILNSDIREELNKNYQDRLRAALADVPQAYYDKIEGLEFRLPHRNSPNITGAHVGGSQLHPFYDGKVVKMLCGIPAEFLEQHYIPYYFAALAKRDIVTPRFADDGWPPALKELLHEHNLVQNGRIPTVRASYGFRSYFPTEKRFGMSGDRIELCNITASNLITYLRDNQSFFDYIDIDIAEPLIRKSGADKTFREMYVHLGLLKSALIHAASDLLFSFSSRSKMQSLVEEFFEPAYSKAKNLTTSTGSTKSGQISDLQDRLLRYEQTIGRMENIIVNTEDGISELGADVPKKDEGGSSQDSLWQADCPTVTFDDVLDAAFKKSTVIPKGGVSLADFDSSQSVVIEGRLLGRNLTNRSALILFSGSESAPFEDLSFSKKLDGFFRYLQPSPGSGRFKVELQPNTDSLADGFSASLQNWKTESPILLVGEPTVSRRVPGQDL